MQLKSEQVSVASPMSFQGSGERLWKLANYFENPTAKLTYQIFAALVLIPMAWLAVFSWYTLMFMVIGWWFLPYRLIRRSQRNNKVNTLRHRELMGNRKEG